MVTDSSFDISFAFTFVFVGALILSIVLKFWLVTRQIRHVAAHRDAVPVEFASRITLQSHQKAASYTIAQARLGLVELAAGGALTLGWTLLGGLNALNHWLLAWVPPGLAQQVALMGFFVLLGSLVDLPFAGYRTFVLEQRFGFNKLTLRLWLQDLLKALVLSAAIGLPLVSAVLWMMQSAGSFWWFWTWSLWMGFNLLMLWVYPSVIAPWFNTFRHLEDAALVARINALMQRCGFVSKGLYVMDGSKRSAHSNAYFTGFGAAKRVVFYDTLLQTLSPGEVDAVLAHELGHFKHRHIAKRLVSMFALSLGAFALLGWLSQQVWFFTGLGVMPNMFGGNSALALLLLLLVLPVFSGFAAPLFAQLSRRHEFEADAYAVSQTNSSDLASALLKLYQDNASTLTPDPLYATYYYSHPPASERLARLRGAMQHA